MRYSQSHLLSPWHSLKKARSYGFVEEFLVPVHCFSGYMNWIIYLTSLRVSTPLPLYKKFLRIKLGLGIRIHASCCPKALLIFHLRQVECTTAFAYFVTQLSKRFVFSMISTRYALKLAFLPTPDLRFFRWTGRTQLQEIRLCKNPWLF